MRTALQSNQDYSDAHRQRIEKTTIPAFLLSLCENPALRRIIDLGCGEGAILREIHHRHADKVIAAVDISCRRLRDLKNRFPGWWLLKADVTRLPVQTATFDLVICNQVIEHVAEEERLIAEIRRIAKKGAYVMVSSVIKKKWALYKHKNRFGRVVLDPSHEREYRSEEDFHRRFQEGFELVLDETIPVRRNLLLPFSVPGFREIYGLWKRT